MKLDVGCGMNPQGDVNIDVSVKPSVYRKTEGSAPRIEPKRISNFVLASAEHLPFKNECFNEVICDSAIEHLKSPYKLLREVYRVCQWNGLIIIVTVHRLSRLLDVFRCRHRGARIEKWFSRRFFLGTFGSRVVEAQIFYELLGIPSGIKVVVKKFLDEW